jgi:hypothetical protein
MKPGLAISNGGKTITVKIPMTFRPRGGRKLIVVPSGAEAWRPAALARVSNAMVKALARAFRWRSLLESGDYVSVKELAKAEGVNFSYMCRLLRLTLLSPKIVETILDGKQDPALDLKGLLKQSSSNWAEQAAILSRASV